MSEITKLKQKLFIKIIDKTVNISVNDNEMHGNSRSIRSNPKAYLN